MSFMTPVSGATRTPITAVERRRLGQQPQTGAGGSGSAPATRIMALLARTPSRRSCVAATPWSSRQPGPQAGQERAPFTR
jgi:hypothetical protein